MAYQQENRFREKVEEKRKKMVDTLLTYIENNPTSWESGWYRMPSESPINGRTQKKYNGLNAFYLSVISAMKGYTDPRWVTFNQAHEMGANVKSGEKSSEVFYWSWYDKKTKKPFDENTLDGMTKEEAKQYRDENVRPVLKFYQVFNANQCNNMPEYVRDNKTPEMELEERSKQVEIIERVIANSAAPVHYDGGNKAYYSPMTDSIHLPEVERFKSMQDFYATALHEIAHSTGHKDRLNREISNGFGSPNYAREELRAELASVFMQVELGISVEGRHFENHGAYLASWLKAVKNNNKEFFAAAADAERIADYVSEHYAQEQRVEEVISTAEPIFEPNSSFAKQVDAVLSGADTTSTHLKVMSTPLILRQLGASNLPILMTAKHLKNIVATEGNDENVNYHGLDADIIKKLPELIADPVMVMDSLTRDDSVVVLTATVDSNNRPIIGAIKFDGKGYIDSVRLEANILTSLYGKDNFNNYIQRNIDAGTVLYWNKEKSQELIEVPGVQFPNKLNSLATNTIIRKAKAFVNNSEPKSQNNLNVSENTNKGQVQQVGQAEQDIYGLIYNWKGLKEENSIYTASELSELDEAFVPEERYDGAVAANKTYMVIRLTGKNQEETEQNIRRFLTGEYNKEEVIPHDDWYWETVTENFFTGEQNQTTIDYIEKLQLSGSDLVMRSTESISDKVREPYRSYLIEQERNPEMMYFKRIGDFYEVMGDNAKIAAEELGLTLTGRDVGLDDRVPMCGVPFYAVDMYIDKLREKFDVMKDGENGIEYLSRKEENTKESYILDFKLNYSNEMLLSNKLAKLGYKRDDSVFERNQNNDIVATEVGIPYWTNEIKYIGKDGRSIVGLYGRTSNGIIIEATDITRFTLNGIKQSEMEDIAKVLRDFGADVTIKGLNEQGEQSEQVRQTKQAQQVEQVKKWRSVELSDGQIGDERGKSTRINMSKSGEYASFVFFVPTKFIRKDEKTGLMQLSVNADFNYTLMRGNQRVELTGEELCQAMAGKVVGKRTQRLLSEENAKTLSDLEHNVPEEMRNYPNWCVFTTRWNEHKGKKDKSIYSPTLGLDSDGKMQWASIDKPETWTTFEAALTFAKENDCAGLVFALNGEGISCIDLDKAIVKDGKLNDKPTDKPEGTLSSIAEKLTSEMLDTYIETSASGNGIHIFVKDDILAKGKYKNRVETSDGEIEVYDEKRFISMTGNIRSKTVRLGKSPVATTSWLQGKLGEKALIKNNNIAPRKGQGIDRSDKALIERIQRSKSAADFNALFNGDNMLGDNSRSDFKLLNMLAFFSDCDAMQMERIFKESKLYRPEKGEQYVQRSVRKAIDTLNTRISEKALGSSNTRGNGGGKRGSSK